MIYYIMFIYIMHMHIYIIYKKIMWMILCSVTACPYACMNAQAHHAVHTRTHMISMHPCTPTPTHTRDVGILTL